MMSVLRCYAVLNEEVRYCQGMHFLAGYLYLVYRNEGMAFSMLSTLIANLDLSYLFKEDVPMLKMYFYQMNRLIAVYLPRLHAHMFEQGLTAVYFCSPWFLTAFTYILQSTTTIDLPPLLYVIFDGFLAVSLLTLSCREASSPYSKARSSSSPTSRTNFSSSRTKTSSNSSTTSPKPTSLRARRWRRRIEGEWGRST
jgi:hypothetical protein